MNISTALILLAFAGVALADGPGRIASRYSKTDFPLTADPTSKEWKSIKGVFTDKGPRGETMPGHRTEIRSRWTRDNLYLLFMCPYEQLYLHPDPNVNEDTNRLWEWDVAEAFLGTDFNNIKQYKEFQVSPQGEWVDLAIDRGANPPNHDWHWNSGYKVKARIDEAKKIWYGEMQIPLKALDLAQPKKGAEIRANFYRMQGPPPKRKTIAWQPTNSNNYHVPEAFGRLVLQ